MNHNDVKSLKKSAVNEFTSLKDKACNACGSIKETAQDAAERIQNALNYSRDEFEETQKQVVQYTKANPVKALGFALLAGYVISKII
jgi:ElaB/YqjD/DUF883 family membrane-anchored ribosome-binding protein